MATYEDIKKANEAINSIQIERKNQKTGKVTVKEYVEVNQRIKAFRMVYPEGSIMTEILSNQNGVCVIRATVYIDGNTPIATGTAYEVENSSNINRTSYIENCETSAVGRALGMCGFGIDTSVASADEILNAELNQPMEMKYVTALKKELEKAGKKESDLEALKDCTGYETMTFKQFQDAMKELGAK